jgi:PmbA protein
VATVRKHIIADGRLQTLLHNLKTAAKAGCASTGNSTRGGQAVTPINLVVQPGDLSLPQLLQTMGTGLVITDMAGLHSGLNPVSGDFSVSAQGYHVVDGVRAGSVDQITVAGNFYTLLKNIIAVANDSRGSFPQAFIPIAPTVLAQGLRVAGK